MLLTCHREIPGISVNALRLSLRNNECVTKEDAELAVGGDRVGLNHQHHAGLKHLLVLFGLDVVGEDMRLGAHKNATVHVDGAATELHERHKSEPPPPARSNDGRLAPRPPCS